MKLQIVKNRKAFFIFSGILVVISLLSWIAWGLKPGIDFTGGSLLEIQFKERPANVQISNSLQGFNLGDIGIQQSGNNKAIIRFKDIDEDTHYQIINKLKNDFGGVKKNEDKSAISGEETEEGSSVSLGEDENETEGVSVSNIESSNGAVKIEDVKLGEFAEDGVVELRFDSIGASIGKELQTKSYKAVFYVVLVIIIYVAWAFRKVSKPVNSWKYGVIAVMALLHDILITIGVFVFLGHFLGTEINIPFIAALLTILGYSVNDTIVVFDRVRENLHRYHESFEETVNDSINETFTRSLNTSLTTIFALLAVYFFGGDTIKDFALALTVGIIFGTYSSIFIASPLLVTWHKISEKFN